MIILRHRNWKFCFHSIYNHFTQPSLTEPGEKHNVYLIHKKQFFFCGLCFSILSYTGQVEDVERFCENNLGMYNNNDRNFLYY